MNHSKKVKPVPGVVIFRFQAPLCFINSGVFRARLEIACDIYKNKMSKKEPNGCIKELFLLILEKTGMHKLSSEESNTKVSYSNSNQAVAFTRSKSFQQAVVNNDKVSDDISHLPTDNNSIAAPVKTVIIDCAPIGFMDVVGVKTLQQIMMDFDKIGIKVLFVAMTEENHDLLAQSGFFQKCSKRWLFPSMQDAVEYAKQGLPLMMKARTSVSGGFDDEDDQQTFQDQEPDNNQQPIKVVEMSTEESTSSSDDVDTSGSHESTHSNENNS